MPPVGWLTCVVRSLIGSRRRGNWERGGENRTDDVRADLELTAGFLNASFHVGETLARPFGVLLHAYSVIGYGQADRLVSRENLHGNGVREPVTTCICNRLLGDPENGRGNFL